MSPLEAEFVPRRCARKVTASGEAGKQVKRAEVTWVGVRSHDGQRWLTLVTIVKIMVSAFAGPLIFWGEKIWLLIIGGAWTSL